MTATVTLDPVILSALHTRFLALLPAIETHGRIYFRHLTCPHKKADAIQEMRALGWKWFVRLIERDKDPAEFVMSFVTLLARAVFNGRRLVGMAKAKDVLNPSTQRRQGFHVEPLYDSTQFSHEQLYAMPNGQQLHDAFEERLRDNTVTPVPEQAAFRSDFPAWRLTRTDRDRRVIDELMIGERTSEVAARYGLSAARISQLRRDFMADWNRFTTDCQPVPAEQLTASA